MLNSYLSGLGIGMIINYFGTLVGEESVFSYYVLDNMQLLMSERGKVM